MISLRYAKGNELALISEIAHQTWPSAYGSILSKAQISYMLEWMYQENILRQQFEEGYSFLLAMEGQKALGFAAFSEIDASNRQFKLHKLYVRPQAQGLGVGYQLCNEVIRQVKLLEGKQLLLNVNRHNPASNFYQNLGFQIIEEVDVPIGNGFIMNDYVMALVF